MKLKEKTEQNVNDGENGEERKFKNNRCGRLKKQLKDDKSQESKRR